MASEAPKPEEILGSFPLGFLLRSLFSGAFFTVACYYAATNHGYKNCKIFDKESALSVGLSVSLIAGVSVYGLHRAFLFPLIEWAFNAEWARNVRSSGFGFISTNTINSLIERWGLEKQNHIRHWADYAHLQYSSFLSIVLGLLAGFWCTPANQREDFFILLYSPLGGLSLAFFVAANVPASWGGCGMTYSTIPTISALPGSTCRSEHSSAKAIMK